MKIITANLNGIRSAYNKGFFNWLATENADVVCVQETKIQAAQMNGVLLNPATETGQYFGCFHYAQKAGYSGVGIYTKVLPDAVKIGFDNEEFDAEGRVICVDLPTVKIISAYFPSGSSGDIRQAAKFRFLAAFLPYLKQLHSICEVEKRGLVVCGDINIAHQNIDLKNWKNNLQNSGFTPKERHWLTQLFTEEGMVDVWRNLYPTTAGYTWWSNRGAAYQNDVGWRIDYQLCNHLFASKACHASIYKTEKFSDHAPLIIEYTDT
jgi:exodeoxyribonuclease III